MDRQRCTVSQSGKPVRRDRALPRQGEHMGRNLRIRNMGSHRRNSKGGSPAMFADTHVEWVKGRQIGRQ
jgi:hypothetical protein